MLYTGIPKKRRKGVPGGNKVACARCGIPGLSLDMVWMSPEGRGRPRVRALVHPECDDLPVPQPVARVLPNRPPYRQQEIGIDQDTPSDAITCSAAIFVTTGTASATVAQATADPTVRLTGTGFTALTYGRINHSSPGPKLRVTTYVSATRIEFELDVLDLNDGTLYVGAAKINAGTQVSEARALTLT